VRTDPDGHDGVLVTGGAKGIGLALSTKLAASGWNVTVCGRDPEALASAGGQGLRAIAADLATSGAIDEIARDWERNGLPRALVCNAGSYGELGNLEGVSIDAWQRSFDLNFFSVARLIQRYVQLASGRPATSDPVTSEKRRKILVLSGSGLGGAKVWPGISAYACAKGALYQLVAVLHEELFARGFDVNCLAPGAVKTGITEQATRAGSAALGGLYDASVKIERDGGDSPALAAAMTAHLLSAACDRLSGRLVSAKWDKLLFEKPSVVIDDPDLYRLRRIDDQLYRRA
jgi:NAD(P)-dependent dehydrogenase (short-subunit alcohol dehydrogenase family)